MAVTQEVESSKAAEGFELFSLGGPILGTNRLHVQTDGLVQISYSHTLDKDTSGVGIFSNRIDPDDLREAKRIHDVLCANESSTSSSQRLQLLVQYAVICQEDRDKIKRRGFIETLSIEDYLSVMNFRRRVSTNYINGSRIDTKLDIAVDSILLQKNKLLVSVKLINSGYHALTFQTPGKPVEGTGATQLSIQATGAAGNHWNVGLLGTSLVNNADYPDDTVTIPARGSIKLQFLVAPEDKVKAGTYRVDAQALMSLSSSEPPANALGIVDFHSDYKNPAKITIDRDYPSTPEEWKDYEARKAKEISAVKPGATIAESGYYRAIGYLGSRGAVVQEFKAGNTAPKLDKDLDIWRWEADLARSTRCEMGQPCPREGEWTLRSKGGYREPDQTHAQYRRITRVGDVLPSVPVSGIPDASLYWEWLGHTRVAS
jgi:hypothetical protein